METTTRTEAAPAAPLGRVARREAIATAFFGTWMITGLFLDGWAHQAQKPETFFSPWHGVLYSGFAAAMVFFTVDGRRQRTGSSLLPTDRLVALGLGTFIAGAVGDFVWHEIFGVEVDIEALLSPTHLLLMTGGVLMLSGPIRAAWASAGTAPSFRGFFPVLACFTLATALVSFFTMYLSAFQTDAFLFAGSADEGLQVHGIGSVFVTNTLLVVPTMLILRRWRPPFGAFTVLWGVVALAMTGLTAFDDAWLVIAALAGGLVADVIAARSSGVRTARIVGAAVPAATWLVWFGLIGASWGLGWAPELWTGTVVLAVLGGLGLSVLAFPPGIPGVKTSEGVSDASA